MNGLCTLCGKPLDRKGAMCQKCKDNHNKYVQETRDWYYFNGICPICGKNKIFDDDYMCRECKSKYREWSKNYQKKKYHERKLMGICVRCGKNKSTIGNSTCRSCREKDNERKRLRYKGASL